MKTLLSIALVALASFSSKLLAQTAIYRLNFDQVGRHVNYQVFEGGFFIAPASGGSGNLILTRIDAPARSYVLSVDYGDATLATEGDDVRMVIAAGEVNEVVNTSMVVIGDLERTIRFSNLNTTTTVRIPEELLGFSVSADNQQDLPFAGEEGDIGVAGFAKVKFTLDRDLTDSANEEGEDVTAATARVEESLRLDGFVDQNATDGPDDGDGGTDGGIDGPDGGIDGPDGGIDGPDGGIDGPDGGIDGPDGGIDGPDGGIDGLLGGGIDGPDDGIDATELLESLGIDQSTIDALSSTQLAELLNLLSQ